MYIELFCRIVVRVILHYCIEDVNEGCGIFFIALG